MNLALSPTTVFDVAGAAYAVAMLVQMTKFLIDYIIKPTDPNQNNVVRVFVFLVSLGFVAGVNFLTYQLQNRADILNTISAAFSVGATAIAGYHLLTSPTIPAAAVTLLASAEPAQPAPILPPVKAGSDSAPILPVVAETKPAPVVLTETSAAN